MLVKMDTYSVGEKTEWSKLGIHCDDTMFWKKNYKPFSEIFHQIRLLRTPYLSLWVSQAVCREFLPVTKCYVISVLHARSVIFSCF